jgi:hypothetical protein
MTDMTLTELVFTAQKRNWAREVMLLVVNLITTWAKGRHVAMRPIKSTPPVKMSDAWVP